MISIEKVKSKVKLLASLNEEELENYAPILESAVAGVEARIKEGITLDEERAELLAAVKANYQIALISDGKGRVTSFSAGDLSITESSDIRSAAKEMLNSVSKDCTDMLGDDGFVFKSV